MTTAGRGGAGGATAVPSPAGDGPGERAWPARAACGASGPPASGSRAGHLSAAVGVRPSQCGAERLLRDGE
eukprot:scaffold517_cov392-Prasinococcus_capsulatus_cf.AAC.19